MKKTIAVIVLIAVAIAGFFGFKELSKTLNSATDSGNKKTDTQPKQEKAPKPDVVIDGIVIDEEYKRHGINVLKNFMLEAKTVVYQAGNQHRDFRNLAIYNNIWAPRYSKYFPWLVGQDLVNKIAKTL